MKILCSYLILAFAGSWALNAESDYSHLPKWQPKTKQVVVFKNGLGFVVKEGPATLNNGWFKTDALPPAVTGSILFQTRGDSTNVIDQTIAYRETVSETIEARSPIDLLVANPGQKMIVTYSLGTTTRTVEGTLVSTSKPPQEDTTSDLNHDSASRTYSAYSHARMPESPGDLVLLRTAMNTQASLLAIPKSSILAVELPGNAQTRVPMEKQVSKARIRVRGNEESTTMSMAYLTKGLNWSPSYRIDISEDNKAQITLDAVLMSDVETLDDTEVLFAVGFPNFLHAETMTPLSLNQGVAAYIQSLAGGQSVAGRSRLTEQSVFLNSATYNAGQSLEPSYLVGTPMPGERREDLYFYKRENVSMKKGDRASFPVFRATVPFEHVYQWNVPDTMNVDARGYRQNKEKPDGAELQVWHVLRLENTTKQPWTTAAAFVAKGTHPLAQDTLRYTPPGGNSTLPVTVATDIRGEQSHNETARRTVTIEGRTYEEVTIQSRLKVTNWKDKLAKMLVQQTLIGEVTDNVDAKVSKVAQGIAALNPTSELKWEFAVEPGESKEFGYTYKVIINR